MQSPAAASIPASGLTAEALAAALLLADHPAVIPPLGWIAGQVSDDRMSAGVKGLKGKLAGVLRD